MQKISPLRLWVGNAGDARNTKCLYDYGIKAVVDLALDEPPALLPRDMLYYRIPLVDGGENDSFAIESAIRTVACLIGNEIPTLIACSAGMSRSPSIAAAGYALAKQVSAEEALKLITANIPTDISLPLWRSVVEVYATCDT